MNEWKEYLLGDVLDKIIGGGTPSTNNPSYWNGGDIFWCTVKDMSDDKYSISNTEDTITLEGLNNSSANLIPKGTVITSTRMGLGRAFINEVEMAINQDLKALIPNSKIDKKYLLWLIIQYRKYLEMLGNGSTVKGIRLEVFKNIKINLPPLPTQKKIAKILSNYDDLIENNLKRIKLLEESARLTYEEWFLRFRIDGKKLDIDPKSGLPFGWGKNNLGFLVNLHGGYPFKSADYGENEKYKIVTIKNVQNGYFDPKTNDSISFLPDNLKQNQKLENGDYIMSLTGNVGRVCLVYGKNYLLNQRVVKLQPKKLFDYSYIYLLFRNKYVTIQLENISNGAAQQNLSPVNVAKIKVPIPSEEQRENFNFKIKPCIDLIIQLNLKNQLLKEARDILLPRLMTGMIDTDDMDITV
jgi:type I restriction enzyme S subunit